MSPSHSPLKIFSEALRRAAVARLMESPIQDADASISAILQACEVSQRNMFATLAVTLRIANDRKLHTLHVDPSGEPFKDMESWIKAMYPETYRYARDAFQTAVALADVPLKDLAELPRCNALLLGNPEVSDTCRRDPETIEAAKTSTEKQFREHLNGKHGQHLEKPLTLRFTGPASGIKKIESALDEIGETWNITDRFGQLEALVEDWQQGGHSEVAL